MNTVLLRAAYFWKDNQVVSGVIYGSWEELISKGFADVLVVDMTTDYPEYRYGIYESETRTWKHVPIEQFSPEFRTHLLIMGVT